MFYVMAAQVQNDSFEAIWRQAVLGNQQARGALHETLGLGEPAQPTANHSFEAIWRQAVLGNQQARGALRQTLGLAERAQPTVLSVAPRQPALRQAA